MSYYVYRYIHPDYPWLYVGKTANLKARIYQHDNCATDNIGEEYKELLKESTVYYIELANPNQGTYIEKMLIDKYKPFLNKVDKTADESPVTFSLPKWQKFLRRNELEVTVAYSRADYLLTKQKM